MNKNKISAIGEVLLYLIEGDKTKYIKEYVSNEANVLSMINCSKYQKEFFTILPKNKFADEVKEYLSNLEIDKCNCQSKDGRQGIIFRSNDGKITLDRKYSAFYFASAMDFDFIKILEESYAFHLSMDAFSISIDSYKYLISALKLAKKKQCLITLSFSNNNFFWNDEQSYNLLNQIYKYVDYLFIDFSRLYNVYTFKKELVFSKEKVIEIYKKLKVNNVIIFNDKVAYYLNKNECVELIELGNYSNESELIAKFYSIYILK